MKQEWKIAARALFLPFVFVVVLWFINLTDRVYQLKLYKWGLLPRELSGLKGLITSPFLHSTDGWEHIVNNTPPILVLGWLLYYHYRKIANQALAFMWFFSLFWVWIIGRESYHIGASTLIYALTGFLFFSGLLRKDRSLMGTSILVAFLYGSIIWGVFPIKENMSYEGHFFGLLAGIIVAWFFRKEGPQRKRFDWEENDDYDETEEKYWEENYENPGLKITYTIKKKED
jgi:membrane associated rhomboid family serine protease